MQDEHKKLRLANLAQQKWLSFHENSHNTIDPVRDALPEVVGLIGAWRQVSSKKS